MSPEPNSSQTPQSKAAKVSAELGAACVNEDEDSIHLQPTPSGTTGAACIASYVCLHLCGSVALHGGPHCNSLARSLCLFYPELLTPQSSELVFWNACEQLGVALNGLLPDHVKVLLDYVAGVPRHIAHGFQRSGTVRGALRLFQVGTLERSKLSERRQAS